MRRRLQLLSFCAPLAVVALAPLRGDPGDRTDRTDRADLSDPSDPSDHPLIERLKREELEAAQALVEAWPEDPSAIGILGNVHMNQSRQAEAVACWERALKLSPEAATGSAIVINEIHYEPADNTEPAEFIELLNASDAPVDLGHWSLRRGIEYTLPAGTLLAPGAFLVVAQSPPAIARRFGVPALGPWQGRLGNEGDSIELVDRAGRRIDWVSYGVGFPWPVAANGEGASMELLHPALDNNAGSAWRATPPAAGTANAQRLVAAGSLAFALVPPDARLGQDWTQPGFQANGWQVGATGVGFERSPADFSGLIALDVRAAMDRVNTSVFVRVPFTVADHRAFNVLLLRMKYDDGFAAFLNGTLVASAAAPDELAWNAEATGNHADADAVEFVTFDISRHIGLLESGSNVLAIQGLNDSLDSSDLLVLPELEARWDAGAASAGATPAAPNAGRRDNPPPLVHSVEHDPLQPASGAPITVRARLDDADGIASVRLQYQIVEPGDYVPSHLPVPLAQLQSSPETPPPPDPDFEDPTNWLAVEMLPQGQPGGGGAAGTLFTATIPGQPNRTLVRYRVAAADSLGEECRAPFDDDPSANFACFVYDGIPDYRGHSARVLEALPVYFLIARDEDIAQAVAYDPADQIPQFLGGRANPARFVFNWWGTFVYDGLVYDHVRFRLSGANGRYQLEGKRNWRVRFNNGRYLRARDQDGAFYPKPWKVLNIGRGLSNRLTLTYGLNEVVNYYLFNQLGVPAPRTHFFHFRVVDGAAEDPDAYYGDFWGMAWAQENYDVSFLDTHGLAKGNLYKLVNSTRIALEQQRYQAFAAVSDGSDHDNIENNLTGYQPADWLLAHVNYAEWFHYHAVCEAIRHYDFWPDANKNAAWYFEPPYTPENQFFGRMWTLPWDTDSTWGPTWNEGHDVVYNSIFASSAGGGDSGQNPTLQIGYRNTVRELRDLLWQPDQVHPVIDFFARRIADFVAADRTRWLRAPSAAGSYAGLSGPGVQSLANYVQDMKNFAFVGGSWPGGTVAAGGQGRRLDNVARDASAPGTPLISYAGAPGFPRDGLLFASSDFADPQGASSFAAMEWRLALVAPPPDEAAPPEAAPLLEWNACWRSGELARFEAQARVPASAVQAGGTYRARVRHRDATGRWSHWSAPLEFTAGELLAEPCAQGLVISEIMYHPAPPTPEEAAAGFAAEDFEFIELANVGGHVLDLTLLAFTEGIEFAFDTGAQPFLAPGARVLVASNLAAFEMRYGTGLPVAGAYGQGDDGTSLANSGERLTLTLDGATAVRDLVYGDSEPWPEAADGAGFSLVLRRAWEDPDPARPASWRRSAHAGGAPGADDTLRYDAWRALHRVGAALDDDDGDGADNLTEYASGTDPKDAGDASAPLPILSPAEAMPWEAQFFGVTFRRAVDAEDASWTVEIAPDLENWTESAAPLEPPRLEADGTETVTYIDPMPVTASGYGRCFICVAVTLEP